MRRLFLTNYRESVVVTSKEKAINICKEWAADFNQIGNEEMAGFWQEAKIVYSQLLKIKEAS